MATKKKTMSVDGVHLGNVHKTFAAEVARAVSKKSVLPRPKKRVWKPTIGAKLGPQEQKLRDLLAAGPLDVSFLFRKLTNMTGLEMMTLVPRRKRQQRIGAIAARHNRKVKSPHIVRGDKPGTYRLKRVR